MTPRGRPGQGTWGLRVPEGKLRQALMGWAERRNVPEAKLPHPGPANVRWAPWPACWPIFNVIPWWAPSTPQSSLLHVKFPQP